jgi:hypothetical protein
MFGGFATAATVGTQDGLKIEVNDADASITGATIDGKVLPLNGQPGGFYVADMIGDKLLGKMSYKSEAFPGTRVAATARQSPTGVVIEGKINDLWVRARIQDRGDYLAVTGDLVNLRPKEDRAAILYFRLPIDATGDRWGKNIGVDEAITADSHRLINPTYFHQGYRPAMSRLPIATLSADQWGLSIAQPMDVPRFFRLTYEKPYGLQIEYEFGLSPVTWKFRNRAPFQFLLYRHDPTWGLRSAFERYYQFFPEQFRKRTRDGMWIDDWEGKRKQLGDPADFGIVFNETGGWADEQQRSQDVLSMAYVEPWCDHIEGAPGAIADMAKDTPDNNKEGRFGRGASLRTNALQLLNSAVYGPDGKILDPRTAAVGGFYIEGKPDSPYYRYLTNPDPELPTPFGGLNRAQKITQYDLYTTWGRTTNNPQFEKDGIYYDSIGGPWAGMQMQNFRRDHMPYVDVPLTFDHKSGKVTITHGFSAIKYARYCTGQAHEEGRPTMGNADAGYFFPFMAPLLDMAGAGESYEYHVDFSDLREMRAQMDQKPLSFLNNNELKDPAKAEATMDALLLYACYPGATNVGQMIAERQLYRAYIPIYNALGAAGWNPVPYAHVNGESDPAGTAAWCERFGSRQSGYFFTIRNPGKAAELTLSLDLKALGLDKASFAPVCGCEVKESGADRVVLKLPAQWTAVVAVNRADAGALEAAHRKELAAFRP